jgi:hypothetical protein
MDSRNYTFAVKRKGYGDDPSVARRIDARRSNLQAFSTGKATSAVIIIVGRFRKEGNG